MPSTRAIDQLNKMYESVIHEQFSQREPAASLDVDLAMPFFGSEWGASEWNDRRQTWRWLGPSGRSHIFVKLAPDSDYLLRTYIHTAVSGEVLSALRICANGAIPAQGGLDWGTDGVATCWCLIERAELEKSSGIVRLTWTVRPEDGDAEEADRSEPRPAANFTKQIAFSRLTCRPYPEPAPANEAADQERSSD